jgi:4-nitrophenyl phosphatase
MHDALPPFLVILDLDGVLYRRTEVIVDAPPSLARLREAGFQLAYLTNNSANTPATVAERLTAMGMPATPDEIFTSAQGAAQIAASHFPGGSMLAVGGPGLREALTQEGLRVVTSADPEQPVDVVVVGIDWDFTYATLARAQGAILDGALFIATNRDPRFPVEEGRYLPGAGSIVAAIATASGVEPIIAGKPATPCIERLMERYGRKPKETLVIGDQLATDILAGNRAGCRTALILTGVSGREEAEALRGISRPTFIYESLTEMADALISDELLVVRR